MPVLIGIAVIAMLGGAIFYNKLRAKMYGIIGVGGSYFATIGIMLLVMLLASLFGGAGIASSPAEIVVIIAFLIIGLGYLVYVMLVKCQTAAQRIFLPFAAILIAFGFCWRFIMALIFKIPMGNGKPETAEAKFPSSLTDDQGDTWNLQSTSSDHADYYCSKTGARATFWYTGDYLNLPAGWRSN